MDDFLSIDNYKLLTNFIIDKTKVAKPFRAIGEGGSSMIIGDSVGESRKKK